jgi:transcriptional regulator with PAS, ATPase and Fis domain
LPVNLQGKLLRVLEERCITRVGSSRTVPVDVRVLAASNEDLRALIARGRFREDLFYRLNVFPVHIPPLRERRADIPNLVTALLTRIGQRLGRPELAVEHEVLEILASYSWPGNVRELRNILERAAILAGGEAIATEHLPDELFESTSSVSDPGGGFTEHVERYKAELLLEALREARWVKKAAAERLGLSPRALSHYVARYSLDRLRDS